MKKLILSIGIMIALIGGGLVYKIKSEQMARIETYIDFARIDPLFAWPGVNLAHMETAVALLKASRAEIVELVTRQYNPAQTDRVERLLYPTDYLSEMIVLEGLRRDLSKRSDDTEIERYQKQLERTIRAYQTYLDVLIPALQKTVKEQRYKGLDYHFGRSSYTHFLSGLQSYHTQSDIALETALKRWHCFMGDQENCDTPRWPVVSEAVEIPVDEAVFESQPAHIVQTLRENSKASGRTVDPSWAVTNSHRCFAAHPVVYYFLWEFQSGHDVPIWRAEVVNDVLVHDHRVTEDTTNLYEKKLQNLGAEGYLYQSFTNHYACPDIAADMALLRAMVYVYRSLKHMTWQDVENTDAKIVAEYATLKTKAQTITSQAYVREDHVQNFMYHLSATLKKYSPEDLREVWGGEQQKTFEHMMLVYQIRTPELSKDIMNLVYSNTAIGDYVNYAPWAFLEELMFTRSAPKLLLGGANPSMIGTDVPQVEQHRQEISPHLRSYNAELSKLYSVEEFTNILIKSADAEYDLNKLQNRSYHIGP